MSTVSTPHALCVRCSHTIHLLFCNYSDRVECAIICIFSHSDIAARKQHPSSPPCPKYLPARIHRRRPSITKLPRSQIVLLHKSLRQNTHCLNKSILNSRGIFAEQSTHVLLLLLSLRCKDLKPPTQ